MLSTVNPAMEAYRLYNGIKGSLLRGAQRLKVKERRDGKSEGRMT